MRLLGVDYGAKRVGLALSDEGGRFALPYRVLARDAKLVPAILEICRREGAALVVLGESRNFRGEPNPIQRRIAKFKRELEAAELRVEYEPEFLTSAAAAREFGKDEELDARAAALILKSYLDKRNEL